MLDSSSIDFHTKQIEEAQIGSFTREELQQFLEEKAKTLSRSTVDHLRWDLNQIFGLAFNDRVISVNPAASLFTPRCKAPKPIRVMTKEEVQTMFNALPLRERLIVKFGTLAGMRPGEILALTVHSVSEGYADVTRRVYRGEFDTPKTVKGTREAALPGWLKDDLAEWLKQIPEEGFLFPSENLERPLWKDNLWRRYIKPKLEAVGLGWVNFQVLRRTATTFMANLQIDPKVRADQQGHTVDVNELIYRQTTLEQKELAVSTLETALIN